ncbi:hypothetical protein EV143_10299 [Flavobacterium chryseum]|nr:hypothetical protein [Flavobacterium sp. P3160]TDO82839.1 hypothetical protein EV143_10299 [Flavobacterium sp. P3160]
MKTLCLKVAVIILISLFNFSCDHCDDEDRNLNQKEEALHKVDSAQIITN